MNKHLISALTLLGCLTVTAASQAFYKSTKATIDTADAQSQDLGVINKQIIQSINLPASGKKIIVVKPTQGDYTNQPVKILFYGIPADQAQSTSAPLNIQSAAKKSFADTKTKTASKSFVAVYRQLPGETNWSSLYETPTVDTAADLSAEDAIKLVINGRADIIAYLPAYQAALKDSTFGSKIGSQQIKIDTMKTAPQVFREPSSDETVSSQVITPESTSEAID